MKLGFVGTGAITEAIVTGLCGEDESITVTLSPRNADRAAALAARFASVAVAADNQAVIEAGKDIVFLAIRPQIAEAVLRPLHFRQRQKVVSLIAATDRQTLLEWIGAEVELTQAIPLPFVAERKGVTALYPPDEAVSSLFDRLGRAIACESREDYDLLAAASALMGTYFGMMEHLTGWLTEKGMAQEKARAYLAPLFASLAQTASQSDLPLDELRAEFSTRGGLNEQVFRDFEQKGGTAALTAAMDRVLTRIETGVIPQDQA
ncbi:pyrroline-5-carboxylate reductase [Xaviernesmea oryzae]|uniref:Pyrroline-5-carboxylate reductase n=1 Tax=Xaviernesmea oryzae TaxID=464029 RepID=A0A1Q9ART0_9HYPH|nr:pyrroline-5-carboxylate reductase [Xaviernesmea oryzae]OLP58110.1 pyrroline-5-carboxylate reductase [Xaviernesmea oryzae]SEL82538.1 pyrroline-5-carboxylate reductase [Xaviernesmea oryzae]